MYVTHSPPFHLARSTTIFSISSLECITHLGSWTGTCRTHIASAAQVDRGTLLLGLQSIAHNGINDLQEAGQADHEKAKQDLAEQRATNKSHLAGR